MKSYKRAEITVNGKYKNSITSKQETSNKSRKIAKTTNRLKKLIRRGQFITDRIWV